MPAVYLEPRAECRIFGMMLVWHCSRTRLRRAVPRKSGLSAPGPWRKRRGGDEPEQGNFTAQTTWQGRCQSTGSQVRFLKWVRRPSVAQS